MFNFNLFSLVNFLFMKNKNKRSARDQQLKFFLVYSEWVQLNLIKYLLFLCFNSSQILDYSFYIWNQRFLALISSFLLFSSLFFSFFFIYDDKNIIFSLKWLKSDSIKNCLGQKVDFSFILSSFQSSLVVN